MADVDGYITPILDALTIHYVVPHPPSELHEASVFQLISPGIAESVGAFRTVALLPRNVVELVMDSRRLSASRMAGRGLSVLPLPADLLEQVLPQLAPRIVVVLSTTEEVARQVDAVLPRCACPVLHRHSTEPVLTRADLVRHALVVADYWQAVPEYRATAEVLKRDLAAWVDPLERTELAFEDRNHFLTSPNTAALASVGCFPRPWRGEPLVASENAPYYEALRESAAPIIARRREIVEANPELGIRTRADLILTVPAVMKLWSEIAPDVTLSDDPQEDRLMQELLRQIIARDTYHFTARLPDGAGPDQITRFPRLSGMMQANRRDLLVYTAALELRAASTFVPVLRLPPSPNGARQEWSQLARAVRADRGNSPHKLNRLATALSRRLSRGVPDWILQTIGEARRIALVSDAPLEWMNVDGFPLMLKADTARIPITPGNLFVKHLLQSGEVELPASAFQKVLLIRSFAENDPLRSMTETAIKHYRQGAATFPDVRIVDVHTREDVVRALNAFDGAILIYNGHGHHPEGDDLGELVLTGEHLSPWSLSGDARIPPIVFLAACDTHPFDASHATIANGFLKAGALTVMGTSVPIGGASAAILVGRLMLRIGMYLPLLIEHHPTKSFRWSEVLPGLQRRQFTTEAIRRLVRVGGSRISIERQKQLEVDVGMAIDRQEDWITLLVTQLAEVLGVSTQRVREKLAKHAAFVDALAYTQLGNPDLVVGVADRAMFAGQSTELGG